MTREQEIKALQWMLTQKGRTFFHVTHLYAKLAEHAGIQWSEVQAWDHTFDLQAHEDRHVTTYDDNYDLVVHEKGVLARLEELGALEEPDEPDERQQRIAEAKLLLEKIEECEVNPKGVVTMSGFEDLPGCNVFGVCSTAATKKALRYHPLRGPFDRSGKLHGGHLIGWNALIYVVTDVDLRCSSRLHCPLKEEAVSTLREFIGEDTPEADPLPGLVLINPREPTDEERVVMQKVDYFSEILAASKIGGPLPREVLIARCKVGLAQVRENHAVRRRLEEIERAWSDAFCPEPSEDRAPRFIQIAHHTFPYVETIILDAEPVFDAKVLQACEEQFGLLGVTGHEERPSTPEDGTGEEYNERLRTWIRRPV